ncbi:unnamed protein product (macronuclear) [Paramecium tetraurelia]|uniref:Uncharacterized protein n=1 Tax=Paramecium tetraurelia TaxID=5888 RepID=A0EGQ7_PARTE|nr:uncharacterized protein GSPATT00026822001 [Paramecium tetraurelia]CAK94498.1 unnamed protein product [Paramecium tetraurelia]|eukprot:XP_001461871.1 hypothetical protein (macronuclear) [Paramecium tetraurelia strain d4-2]
MSFQKQIKFKIHLIGHPRVGKTAIITQFIDSNIDKLPVSIGMEIKEKNLIFNNLIVTLQFWDGPGHEKFQRGEVYRGLDCLIIVYDSNGEDPIKTLDYWNKLQLDLSNSKDREKFPIFVIKVNKNNIVENNEILESIAVLQWCKQNRIKQFFKVSYQDNLIINETFIEITKILLGQKSKQLNIGHLAISLFDDSSKDASSKNTILKSQLKCNMQDRFESIQCQHQHDSPPIIVLLDNNLKGVKRLVCSQCINDIRGPFNGINIDEAIKIIEEQKNNLLEIVSDFSQKNISLLNCLIEQILQQKALILQSMDQMINQVNNWIDEIKQLEIKQCSYSFIDEIDQLNKSIEIKRNIQVKEVSQLIDNINLSYETKIQNTNQLLQIHLQRTQNILRSISSSASYQELNIIRKNNIEKIKEYNQLDYQLVSEVRQQEQCHALAFNHNQSIMAASLNNNIVLWSFQKGQLLDKKASLYGHQRQIKCIIFSKKKNWLFSGSEDNTIRSWKEQETWFSNSKWESRKADKTHTNWVNELLLNDQENELISCSVDQTVKIWKIQYDSNSIKFVQSLEKHQKSVLSISLNQSQQQLISWGEDKQVVLWEKNYIQKWQFKNIVLLYNQIQGINIGVRFLMDHQIICKTSNGQIEIYKQTQDQYESHQVLDFDVQNSDENSQETQINYNIQTQLIVMQYKKCFYFFRNSYDDNKLQQVCQPLIYESEVIFFNITNDGKYFVVFQHPLFKFRIYELKYIHIQ